ncbi:MAG: glycosyltransferase family 39 protein [Flavobacteriales bacterium]|nr:glycosyltransferase family 39 protein [Flavobacteriales bacterium]
MTNRAITQLLAVLISACYLVVLLVIITLPLHMDEAITYRYFVSKGWKIAVSVYSDPNNHVLYSLFSILAVKLPLHPFVAIRIPSLLAGLGCGAIIYRIVRMYASTFWSLFAVMAWISSLGGLYYLTHARGYGLQCLFILWSYLITLKIIRLPDGIDNLRLWALLIVVCSFGFFTLPTFLFPFVSIIAILLFRVRSFPTTQLFWRVFAFGAIVTFTTTLLYLPVLKYSGLEFLTNNSVGLTRKLWNISTENSVSFFVDLVAYVGPVLLSLAGISIFLYRRRMVGMAEELKWHWVAFTFLPLLLVLLVMTVPFPRNFAYFTSLFAIFGTLHLARSTKFEGGLVKLVLILILGISFTTLIYRMVTSEVNGPDKSAQRLITQLNYCSTCDTIYTERFSGVGAMINFYAWYDSLPYRVVYLNCLNIEKKLESMNTELFMSSPQDSLKFDFIVAKSSGEYIYSCQRRP